MACRSQLCTIGVLVVIGCWGKGCFSQPELGNVCLLYLYLFPYPSIYTEIHKFTRILLIPIHYSVPSSLLLFHTCNSFPPKNGRIWHPSSIIYFIIFMYYICILCIISHCLCCMLSLFRG